VNLRRSLQGLFLLLFFLLFFTSTTSFSRMLPPDLFLRSDPLAGMIVSVMAWSAITVFLPALVVVGSALLMGRAFCGYACPLGTLADLGARLARTPHEEPSWLRRRPGLPLLILLLVLASSLLGFSLLAWLDPLVLLSRTTALVLQPWLLEAGRAVLGIFRPLASRIEWFWLSDAELHTPRYWLEGLSVAWMGGILALSLWRSRLWCRAVCPLGSLLGVLGQRAVLARRVGDSCVECGACEKVCPMGAIGRDPRHTSRSRCLICGRCGEVCPGEAIGFLPMKTGPARAPNGGWIPLSRRALLAAGAGGLMAGLTVRVDAGRAAPRDRLIRPPGALPEPLFLDRCLRCGLCMSVCMSHTIQPSLWEAGLDGIWSPRLDLRLAPCEKHCNRCGQVCPTGAVRPLSLEERTHAKIGTAILLRERCLVWEQDKKCLVCDEICPYDAIEFREVEGMRRPFVTESRCNGCGYCEHKCPVQGQSAIVVARMGEIRLEKGSFVEEARARGFVFEGSREEGESAPPSQSREGELPPGFLRP
jgi:ferredoxin-type protein NapF